MITGWQMKAFTVWDWIVQQQISQYLKPWSLLCLGLYLQKAERGSATFQPDLWWLVCPPQPRIQLITRSVINSAVFGPNSFGSWTEAVRLSPKLIGLQGIFAASYFEAGRMPELFAGIERQPETFCSLPDANVPQAWAGSVL